MDPIRFWFFIGSTYTYLSVSRIEEVARRYDRRVEWCPFSVRSIMLEQNNIPFRNKPVKTAYMQRDIERRARRHRIPFGTFPPYPVDQEELATRVALLGVEEGWCAAFAKAIYRGWFLQHELPVDRPVLERVLSEIGVDAADALQQADSPQQRERYNAQTERAKQLGIFGSPTFEVAGEIFWGDDRMEEAMEWSEQDQQRR